MRTIVHKAFAIWNFDKEEKWLNEMAARGLCLAAVGFCRYEFEDCNPGEYEIRLELLDRGSGHPVSRKYMEFVEETGAENVGYYGRWVYFRKKKADGGFELFSDNTSRIRHLARILLVIGAFGCLNLLLAVDNWCLYLFWRFSLNLICALLSTMVFGMFAAGFIRIFLKRRKLQKEQRLFE